MTVEELRSGGREGLGGALLALWLDHHGDWEGAHAVAQDMEDADGAWVHAYLHRKEGDVANARYWYRRARRPPSELTSQQEWEAMTGELLVRMNNCRD